METTNAQRAHDRATDAGLCVDTLLESFALVAWADGWASAIENAQEDCTANELAGPDKRDFGSFSGCEITEICPDTIPGEFLEFTRVSVLRILLEASDSDLKAWAEFEDDDRIGSDFYMDAVGHGVGLEDRDLPSFDCFTETPPVDSQELEDTNGEFLTPTPAELNARDIGAKGKRDRDATCKAVAGVWRAWLADHIAGWRALELSSELIGAYGWERVQLPAPDGDTPRGSFEYVNTGDTYAGTVGILDDWRGVRIVCATWGDIYEQAERERTERTGQTRCPHCSEWGGELDNSLDYGERGTCADCGHVD